MGNKCVPPEKANVNCRQVVLETGLEGGAHSHMPPPGRELVLQEQGLRVGVRAADKAWRKRWEESREPAPLQASVSQAEGKCSRREGRQGPNDGP